MTKVKKIFTLNITLKQLLNNRSPNKLRRTYSEGKMFFPTIKIRVV